MRIPPRTVTLHICCCRHGCLLSLWSEFCAASFSYFYRYTLRRHVINITFWRISPNLTLKIARISQRFARRCHLCHRRNLKISAASRRVGMSAKRLRPMEDAIYLPGRSRMVDLSVCGTWAVLPQEIASELFAGATLHQLKAGDF